MNREKPIRVMFVCAGNICRSPMAEAVFRHLVHSAGLSWRFDIASSGTGDWHVGERPHPGTQAVLQRHGIPLKTDKRAQHLARTSSEEYDYIIVADDENLFDIQRWWQPGHGELRRLLEFAPHTGLLDVPDPFYTGGFDRVYDLVLAGCQGLLDYIRAKEGL